MDLRLHADREREALVHGADLAWVPSPQAGVERRMLERSGGEVALASTIVRYAPDSRFPRHSHPLGEEFLVLEGIFSDEHGDYPAGSYVRNPPGSAHAPYSRGGCVIFVKLRQMQEHERDSLCLRPGQWRWETAGAGRRRVPLYTDGRISVALERVDAGRELDHRGSGGLEIFVVNGDVSCVEGAQALRTWSWLRSPARTRRLRAGSEGALLWVKRGHLGDT